MKIGDRIIYTRKESKIYNYIGTIFYVDSYDSAHVEFDKHVNGPHINGGKDGYCWLIHGRYATPYEDTADEFNRRYL